MGALQQPAKGLSQQQHFQLLKLKALIHTLFHQFEKGHN